MNCRCYSHSIQGQKKHREKSGMEFHSIYMRLTWFGIGPQQRKNKHPFSNPHESSSRQPLIAVSHCLFVWLSDQNLGPDAWASRAVMPRLWLGWSGRCPCMPLGEQCPMSDCTPQLPGWHNRPSLSIFPRWTTKVIHCTHSLRNFMTGK